MIQFSNRLPQVLAAFAAAQDAGVRAAAYVYRNAVVSKLIRGFKSGRFVTGMSANSVTIGPVYTNDSGGKAIRVGTNVLYDLYWTLGHHNHWTRKYERVDYWGPTVSEQHEAMIAAYQVAARRAFQAAAG